MEFERWEPVYETVLADFGFDRAGDERARDLLATETTAFDISRLSLSGQRVAIVGAGPSLETGLNRAATADAVVAASTAADRLLDAGIELDCLVTDLDGSPETARELTEAGVAVAVHAHGDNIPAIREYVPRFDPEWVVPTTQAEPVGPVRNFGGFTDGDRAAFLADHLGGAELVFVGWDFDDPTVSPLKQRKLAWAERLLAWLEGRRDERFAVLDGRREEIDLSWH